MGLREIPARIFDFVWASPPCTEYSRAKTTGVRDIEAANRVVRQTLRIIEHLKPRAWLLENPQTGLLKNQPFMKDLHYVDVDYCRYGCDYRKRTRLWGNLEWSPLPLCEGDCGKVVDGRHIESAQKAGNKRLGQRTYRSQELYSVPKRLTDSIASHALQLGAV